MANWIDRGRLPDYSTAITARLATVVRHDVSLPKQLAGVGIERHYAPAKSTARIASGAPGERKRLLLRRDPDVNNIAKDHWGARDLGGDMTIDTGDPVQSPCFAVGSNDAGTRVEHKPPFYIAHDDVLAVDGGTRPRECAGEPIVIGDLVGPDQLARVLVDGKQVASPIRKKHGVTGDG